MASAISILQDISQWDIASYEVRKKIAQQVASQLGPDYMYVGFKDYAAGGQKHQIMAIEHQPTLMVFHLIPGGSFELGTSEAEQALCEAKGYNGDLPEEPTTRLSIAPFLLACSPITEKAMKVFRGETDQDWKCGHFHAADAISRKEARAWCQRFGMRLPSEAEWEYACRAGTNSLFYWGNEPDASHCWMKANYATGQEDCHSHSYMEHLNQTNAFGLIDMLGLMGEWVEDDSHDYAWHDPAEGPYRSDSDNSDGILRGGCFMYDWKFNRCATRINCADYGDSGISFRPAIDLPALLDTENKEAEKSQAEAVHDKAAEPGKKWWKIW